MSSSGIFDTEQKNSSNGKIFVIAGIALMVLVGIFYALYAYNKSQKPTEEQISRQLKQKEITDSVIAMLGQSSFSGDEFEKQILGKGRMEKYDWVNKDAYFYYPEPNKSEYDEFVNKFFINPAKIESAVEKEGRLHLGKYSLAKTPETGYFFRTPFDNIKIETDQTLKFPYNTVTYDVSLEEVDNFVKDESVYGGRLIAGKFEGQNPMPAFANHGIMVAKPNEPSLNRLVNNLFASDASIGNDREKKIQRLLDFVTNEIEYSYSEALSSRETLKRPDETLITRSADCSNKTILMASLLEQIGEDYLLLYAPGHITVAVPQGNFVNENKLDFKWNDKNWMIAETTVPNFQIGKTKVNEAIVLGSINYVQVPKQIDIIFDANSYNLIKFY